MNKIKKIIYNVLRNYVKNYITGNLGKVVEDDEKLTCYINKEKIKKQNYHYTISLFGITENNKRLADAYNLNKPICYIIDGITFKKKNVYIFGYEGCEVIIKNCNFEFGMSGFIHSGKCTLDNTYIRAFSNLSFQAKELAIQNMNSTQLKVLGSKKSISFTANDKLYIINSTIGKEKTKVSLAATNELNIINSKIIGNEILCKSPNIRTDENSSLTASDKVNLEIDDFNAINITTSTIILNNDKISNEKKSVTLKKITDPLALKRLELIKILRKLKNECEQINSEKIKEYKSSLEGQSISKVLKNKY